MQQAFIAFLAIPHLRLALNGHSDTKMSEENTAPFLRLSRWPREYSQINSGDSGSTSDAATLDCAMPVIGREHEASLQIAHESIGLYELGILSLEH